MKEGRIGRFRFVPTACLTFVITLMFACSAMAAVVKGRVTLEGTGLVANDLEVRANFRPQYTAITDDSGRFCIEGIKRGIYTFVTHPPGYFPARYRINIADSDTAWIELKLVPRMRNTNGANPGLKIIIIGGLDASVVPGTRVSISGPLTGNRNTDNVGKAVFRDLKPGRYTITATHPDHGNISSEIVISPGPVIQEKILRFFPGE